MKIKYVFVQGEMATEDEEEDNVQVLCCSFFRLLLKLFVLMLSFRIMALTAIGDCQNCLVSWVVGVLCQSSIVASTSFFSTPGRRRNPADVHETPFLLVRKAQRIFD